MGQSFKRLFSLAVFQSMGGFVVRNAADLAAIRSAVSLFLSFERSLLRCLHCSDQDAVPAVVLVASSRRFSPGQSWSPAPTPPH